MGMFTQSAEGNGNIGELIKIEMKKRVLSMRKLSAITGMDTATISRILSGKQEPKLSHLKLFSEYLGIPLEILLGVSREAVGDPANSSIMDSVAAISEILGTSQQFDPQVTTELIQQELIKYEQYAQTAEGHRIICQEFETKVNQVNGIGPLIEHLKQMYIRYNNEDTSRADRSVLGSALLYFILSADIIPDYVFPIGYLDDAIAVYLVLSRLNQAGNTA